jgi:putative transcriptional regulator
MSPLRFLLLLSCLGVALTLRPTLAWAQIDGKSILLVASTQMQDPRFRHTVILVTRHGRSPPLGVIINRPLKTGLGTLFPDLPESEAKRPLFLGGPVALNQLAFLFRSPTGSADAIAVAPETHLGRSAATLAELLRGPRTHTGLRVFVGYAGWAEGQLESEIAHGSWHVMPVAPEILFDKDVDLIWPELIRRASQKSIGLPRFPSHPLHSPSLKL